MVSTRQHPKGDFPEFEPSPTKRQMRTSTASPAPTSPTSATRGFANNVSPTAKAVARRAVSKTSNAVDAIAPPSPSEINESGWCHTASNLTILWLTISWPLVLWDVLYILLRPHTMAGGALQWPIWKPYEIYASIDHVYGWPGWDNNDGFGGAQGAINAVEVVLYGLYVTIIYNHSVPAATGTGLDAKSARGLGAWLSGGRKVRGRAGNHALLLGFTAAVLTLGKTVLYFLNEYFSHFKNVGHNDWLTVTFLYCIMNGLWVVFPAYMAIVFGSDILQALNVASGSAIEKQE